MRLLLHTCCAPCTIGPLRALQADGHQVTGCFYNPNVHPLIEFRRRLKAQKLLADRLGLETICEEQYGLWDYLEVVDWRGPGRCEGCYRMRMGRVARLAREGGFEAVTTTLLSSRQQDHELVRRIGEECAEEHGVRFLYCDWRDLSEEGHREARAMGLYMQQYCGCIFSEYERFKDTTKHLYRGPGG